MRWLQRAGLVSFVGLTLLSAGATGTRPAWGAGDISTGGNSSIGAPSTNDPIDSSNGQMPGVAAPGSNPLPGASPPPAAVKND